MTKEECLQIETILQQANNKLMDARIVARRSNGIDLYESICKLTDSLTIIRLHLQKMHNEYYPES